MEESQQMQAQAEKIRSNNVLGRSGLLLRLFEFLLQQSLAARRPKEQEIAIEVFGKSTSFDVSQDATIRVYIHKLRRRLEEHYAAAGSDESIRIVIPKGEYRLVLEHVQAPAVHEAPSRIAPTHGNTRLRWVVAILIASLLGNAALVIEHLSTAQREVREFQGIRDHLIWSRLLDDELPIYLVLGDYYIFGETDGSMDVKRLIREFTINSPEDLQQEQYLNPKLSSQYLNLDLSYLPVASAFALRSLIPILATKHKRIEVVLISDLTANMIKSAHIVYVGYLSGMGMLHDLVFAPSRFSIGDTYDELIDTRSKRHYVSQAGMPVNSGTLYKDYGYFSSFKGPNDNQILVIAGTRDVAVAHTAEALADARALRELSKPVSGASDFEALYEVSGIDRTDVKGRLVISSPLATRDSWSK